MRKHRALRLRAVEALEPRAVPTATLASVTVSTGLPGINVTLPAQVPINSPQVKAAFVAFDQSYLNAVNNVLLAPGPNGLVVPSANRAAFDAAIENSLNVLARSLLQSLGGTSTTSPAASQITEAITGGGSNSLESQLQALSDLGDRAGAAADPQPRLGLDEPGGHPAGREHGRAGPPDAPAARLVGRPQRGSARGVEFNVVLVPVLVAGGQRHPVGVRELPQRLLQGGPGRAPGGRPGRPGQPARSPGRLRRPGRPGLADAGHPALGDDRPLPGGLDPRPADQVGHRRQRGRQPQEPALESRHAPGAQAAVVRDFTLGSAQAIARALSQITGDVSKALGTPVGN